MFLCGATCLRVPLACELTIYYSSLTCLSSRKQKQIACSHHDIAENALTPHLAMDIFVIEQSNQIL